MHLNISLIYEVSKNEYMYTYVKVRENLLKKYFQKCTRLNPINENIALAIVNANIKFIYDE